MNLYKQLIISLFITVSLFRFPLFASHNRAGEITYRQLGGVLAFTFEITLTTYTKTSSRDADRPEAQIFFGDNTTQTAPRIIEDSTIGNDTKKNVYKFKHQYPGACKYVINYRDPNSTVWLSEVSIKVVNQTLDVLRVSAQKAIYNPAETMVVKSEALKQIGDQTLFVSNVSINGTMRNSSLAIGASVPVDRVAAAPFPPVAGPSSWPSEGIRPESPRRIPAGRRW